MRCTGFDLLDLGLLPMRLLQSATHSSQMYTPGPATNVPTSLRAFRQNEHKARCFVVVIVALQSVRQHLTSSGTT